VSTAAPLLPLDAADRTQVPLQEILADLEALLTPGDFEDYGPNGLQVPGRELVARVVTGVSATAELFARASEVDADLVITHHGILWGSASPIDRPMRRRLELLFAADISLAAFHIPLDAHPEVGNNAVIAQALGASERAPFARHRGAMIGCEATFAGEGIAATELIERVRALTGGREPLVFKSGPERVRRLGVVSGGGCEFLGEAIARGLDAFLTGEPTERVMAESQEAGIHFIAAGHYATETFGVRALGDRLSARFGIEHIFVDVPNPI
jgi:dinuclear metal center YbgI/SA1388 family protein